MPLPSCFATEREGEMAKFKPGQRADWKWPPGYVSGIVMERFTETVRLNTKGKWITRHGCQENPAYRLRTRKGVDVLKLESELMPPSPLESGSRKKR